MYIVRIERRMERILTRPCAARSTLVYLERGGVPRCTKSVESVNQASWQGKWCPGEVLDPSHKQRCIIWNAWYEILHILRQLNAEPCPAWTTERGKLKRGWSPGDSLNLVRVLSVRVNYSQQCRNDINGRWEYSKSIKSIHVPYMGRLPSVSNINRCHLFHICWAIYSVLTHPLLSSSQSGSLSQYLIKLLS